MSGSPASLFKTKKLSLTIRWSWSKTLEAVCRSCPSPIFRLRFGNRYTHIWKGLCQISHFIPEVNDFTQILALAPLLLRVTDQSWQTRLNQSVLHFEVVFVVFWRKIGNLVKVVYIKMLLFFPTLHKFIS